MEFDFPFHIWDVILPIDELIFFKMVKTTNQKCLYMFIIHMQLNPYFISCISGDVPNKIIEAVFV